ncbi:RusA-like resolvase [Arthrobacter phage EastWest]|uniref:RusA-like resolvase n=1 Tax=Arthrobacter phage EastWest TaxID=2894292 RepID=A0AAE8YKH5_9CAUD|nr:RusA-like resolvase [Arthrobacter phage EastWest]
MHEMTKASRNALWRQLTEAAARDADDIVALDWARIVVWVRFPTNQRREVSNLQPTAKAIVDGIVDAGLLPDDRDECCTGPDMRRIWPNGEHRVIVQLWRKL